MHPAVPLHPLFHFTFTHLPTGSKSPPIQTLQPSLKTCKCRPHACPAPPPCCQISHNWRSRHFCCRKQIVKPGFPPPLPPHSITQPPLRTADSLTTLCALSHSLKLPQPCDFQSSKLNSMMVHEVVVNLNFLTCIMLVLTTHLWECCCELVSFH